MSTSLSSLVSLYVYRPAKEIHSTTLSLYHESGPAYGREFESNLHAAITNELGIASPDKNPFTIYEQRGIVYLIHKYFTQDREQRPTHGANILCANRRIFSEWRGFSTISLLAAAQKPNLLSTLNVKEVCDSTKSMLVHYANLTWPSSIAEVIGSGHTLKITASQRDIYDARQLLNAAISLLPNEFFVPYVETVDGNTHTMHIGENASTGTFLGGLLAKRSEMDYASNRGLVRSNFYEPMLLSIRDKLFSDDAFDNIAKYYKMSQFFGNSVAEFANTSGAIRNEFYEAIKRATREQIFSPNPNKTLELSCALADAIGRDNFISFVTAYRQSASQTYTNMQTALDSLQLGSGPQALEIYYKMEKFFGERKLREFLKAQQQ